VSNWYNSWDRISLVIKDVKRGYFGLTSLGCSDNKATAPPTSLIIATHKIYTAVNGLFPKVNPVIPTKTIIEIITVI
jgi:hypothetical protein